MGEAEPDGTNYEGQVISDESGPIDAMTMRINPDDTNEVPMHIAGDTAQPYKNDIQHLLPAQVSQQSTLQIQPSVRNALKNPKGSKSGKKQRPLLPNTLLGSRIPLEPNSSSNSEGQWVLSLQYVPKFKKQPFANHFSENQTQESAEIGPGHIQIVGHHCVDIVEEEAEEISDDAVEALLNRLKEIQTPIPDDPMRFEESIPPQTQGNKIIPNTINEELPNKDHNFEVSGNEQYELEVENQFFDAVSYEESIPKLSLLDRTLIPPGNTEECDCGLQIGIQSLRCPQSEESPAIVQWDYGDNISTYNMYDCLRLPETNSTVVLNGCIPMNCSALTLQKGDFNEATLLECGDSRINQGESLPTVGSLSRHIESPRD
ncbi:hypothetical protein Aperf_G00000081205 [Anoplocephala perfoliata]